MFEKKAKDSFFNIIQSCIQYIMPEVNEVKKEKFKPQLEFANHPPNGVYCNSDSRNTEEFVDSRFNVSENGGDSATVLAPGICSVPEWQGTGSLFYFDWNKNCWTEIHIVDEEGDVIRTDWNALGTSCEKKPHPVEGKFSYLDEESDFKDSKPEIDWHFTQDDIEIKCGGVFDHKDSLFFYNWKDDTWNRF